MTFHTQKYIILCIDNFLGLINQNNFQVIITNIINNLNKHNSKSEWHLYPALKENLTQPSTHPRILVLDHIKILLQKIIHMEHLFYLQVSDPTYKLYQKLCYLGQVIMILELILLILWFKQWLILETSLSK